MISTLHGDLPLVIYPAEELPLSMRGRAEICRIRGKALGQALNATVTLDVNTGELLIMSADGFVGTFRLGDLIVASCAAQILKEHRNRAEEGRYGAPTH